MMAQHGLTLRGFSGFGRSRSSRVERVQLEHDQIHTLRGTRRWLRVTSGSAWVTDTGLDLIVQAGEIQRIDPGKYGAVVTSLDRCKLEFETWLA